MYVGKNFSKLSEENIHRDKTSTTWFTAKHQPNGHHLETVEISRTFFIRFRAAFTRVHNV